MAFDVIAKAYLKNLKETLTEDQWASFLKLTNAQKKAQIIAAIDADIASLDASILDLENRKIAEEARLTARKDQLTLIKNQVTIEL